MQDSNPRYRDLNEMLVNCLDAADYLSLSVIAVKICEAIELLEHSDVERDES